MSWCFTHNQLIIQLINSVHSRSLSLSLALNTHALLLLPSLSHALLVMHTHTHILSLPFSSERIDWPKSFFAGLRKIEKSMVVVLSNEPPKKLCKRVKHWIRAWIRARTGPHFRVSSSKALNSSHVQLASVKLNKPFELGWNSSFTKSDFIKML